MSEQLSDKRVRHLIANPGELSAFLRAAEKNADDWLTLNAEVSRLRDTQRVLVEALEGLMEVERRNRLMPIGAAWDAARAALVSVEEQPFYQTVPADEEVTARPGVTACPHCGARSEEQAGDKCRAGCPMTSEGSWAEALAELNRGQEPKP